MASEEPIRIAHVIGKMVGGGVEAVVMNYYRHIDKSQFQFDFIIDEDSTVVPKEEIESLGGRVIVVPPYQHVFKYRRALITLFKKEKWDIVVSHINTLSIFPLSAAKAMKVPVRIAHSHSTSGKGEFAKNAVKYFLRLFANIYPTERFACSQYAGK
jgi:glycosyltransferase EpsF